LGEKSNLSTSAVGRLADIIAIKGDPLEDISHLQHASFVIKHGQIFKSP
jgi:imidazolonepropionase-like amidohydrolase